MEINIEFLGFNAFLSPSQLLALGVLDSAFGSLIRLHVVACEKIFFDREDIRIHRPQVELKFLSYILWIRTQSLKCVCIRLSITVELFSGQFYR